MSVYIPVKEYAAQEGVHVSTVYKWIKHKHIRYQQYEMDGRAFYLVDPTSPRPEKRTKVPTWLNHSVTMRKVPIVDLPWHEDQRTMQQILDEVNTP